MQVIVLDYLPDSGHLAGRYPIPGRYYNPGMQLDPRPCLDDGWKLVFGTVALSFVFDKYCPIMTYLGSKNSSRNLQSNYVISYFFYLHLLLHACVPKFDVMKRE